MKSSPVVAKKMVMSKNFSQRAVERKIRTKYSSYIYRLLKQDGKEQSVAVSKDLMDSIASEAARLCLYNKRRTITKREVDGAIKRVVSRGRPNSVTSPANQ
ncbi:uncharacterized protein ACMZJ9_010451 [Mantella aurantiaca]